MTLSLFEPTYTVSQLCGEIREFLGEAFNGFWVAGEAQRVRLSARGHLYFELVEKGEADEITGKLEAVIWKTDLARVRKILQAGNAPISEGVQIRCRGSVDFYAPGGRLQLCVREVDPAFTLGQLERRRRETLAALAEAGLLDLNRAHPFPELPLSIALVTSHGSAAYHDFLACLSDSGYGFRVLFVHAAVQGREAEREVASALASLAGLPVDLAVLVRGGGARTDLAVFDSRRIAEAIARAPFPVVTGLGHEIDRAIADRVAHTSVRTPTQAAELLIDAVARLDGRVAEIARGLARLGRAGLKDAVRGEAELTGRLAGAALRRLDGAVRDRAALGARLAASARGKAREAAARLDGLARLAGQLAPERTLARGFTLTRDGGGKLLRSPAQVAPGDAITTLTAGGALRSRVEA